MTKKETLAKSAKEIVRMDGHCFGIRCVNCPLTMGIDNGYSCIGSGEKKAKEAKRYLAELLKRDGKWHTLNKTAYTTMESANSFDDFEIEYMVLPTGDWSKVKSVDGRMEYNILLAEDTKLVYRYKFVDPIRESMSRFMKANGGMFEMSVEGVERMYAHAYVEGQNSKN